MLYAKTTSPRGFVLNLLDYNVPLNYTDKTYDAKKGNYEITLSLPGNVKVKHIRSFDVSSLKSKQIKHLQDGSAVRFSLARCEAYTVCEISI